MIEMSTKRGELIQISDEDSDLVDYSWNLDLGNYVQAWIGDSTKKLHKIISKRMGLSAEMIDHKDRDKLNNQRDNLRESTRSQNMANSKRVSPSTGYRGVTYHLKHNKYQVSISHQKSTRYLGLFLDAREAARCYDKWAKYYFGEFAALNFPEEHKESA